jgi:hypothetical protein
MWGEPPHKNVACGYPRIAAVIVSMHCLVSLNRRQRRNVGGFPAHTIATRQSRRARAAGARCETIHYSLSTIHLEITAIEMLDRLERLAGNDTNVPNRG